MISDEERKIETFKKYINSQEQKMNDYYKIDEEFYKDEIDQLELSIKLLRYILNLIEKQQKEIEELIEENNTTIVLEANRRNFDRVYNLGKIYTNKKWKDKIKAKIEEWDKDIKWNNADDHYYAIKMMQSLLEKET